MNPFETIAAIIDGARPLERPVFDAPAVPQGRGSDQPKERRSRKAAADQSSPASVETTSPPASADAETSEFSEPSLDSSSDETDPRNPSGEANDLDATLAECAQLDHSDTDNGKRLITYFGGDLTVRAESEVAGGSFLTWAGTHWDLDGGAAGASKIAQRVGPLIMREAEFLQPTPSEERAIAAADKAKAEIKGSVLVAEDRQEELEAIIVEGKKARSALSSRRAARRKFGVSSKNNARIEAMKTCAAPHLRKPIDAFNADALKVATRSHTLAFERRFDDECPDPETRRIISAEVVAARGHRREDFLTAVIPCDYDPKAKAKRWLAFVDRFLPDEATRRTVQQFSGLGLTGLQVQRFMLHHGTGANGKSVFLEVLARLLGPSLAVGLPVESIMAGGQKSGSQASPDIARLFGKRMVRVVELPEGVPLSVDVVKKLTGGEEIPVRTLFKGFFEIRIVAKPHFSTNGQPKVEDASNGIWRRMLRVEWPIQLAENEQRDFDDVVGELLAEGPGILNWLIEGVRDYLVNGLVVSDGIRAGTQDYRDDMDPTGPFVRDCISPKPGDNVQASMMYEAYVAWSVDAARRPVTNTKFGLLMKHKVKRDDKGRRHAYLDVALHDVPAITEEQREKAGLARRKPSSHPNEPPPYDPAEVHF